MPLSVNQVVTEQTDAQVLAFLLDTLTSVGFKVGSWHEGSVQRNVLEAVSRNGAAAGSVIAGIAERVIVKPRGIWQDLIGVFRYQLPRIEAVPTERNVTLTATASAPVSVIENRNIIAVNQTRFFVQELGAPVTLNPGDTLTVSVIAEFGGVAGNTAVQPKIADHPGVTAEWSGDPTVNGVEREGDDRYQLRIDRRWAELTYSVGLRAYELWALTAAPSVTRAKALNNYPIPNAVRIVLDPGEPSEIAQVEAYIAGRHPPNDVVTVQAVNRITKVLRLRPRVLKGTTVTQLTQALDKVIYTDMPIGGWLITGAIAGRFLREKLSEALLCQNGAQSAGIELPATDEVMGSTDVVDPTYDIELETAV